VFLVCVFSVEEIGVVGCGCNRLYRIVAGLKFCSCSSFCFCAVRLMSRLVAVFGFAGRLVAVFGFAGRLVAVFFADLLLFFFLQICCCFFLQISCCFFLQISCCFFFADLLLFFFCRFVAVFWLADCRLVAVFRFLLSFAGRLQISSLLLSDCRLLSFAVFGFLLADCRLVDVFLAVCIALKIGCTVACIVFAD
jgi:hypothetical protein